MRAESVKDQPSSSTSSGHLCTVADGLTDPLETLSVIPDRPQPWWGWGSIPDQYGRDWNGDDGDTRTPPAPDGLTDLPPILPWWGPRPWRARTAPPDSVEDGSATAT